MMRAATKRGDEGGGRATAKRVKKRVKKRVSAARARMTAMATATWVAASETDSKVIFMGHEIVKLL